MDILLIILLLAFVILFVAYVRLVRINKRRTRPYSWVRSDKLLPQTKRQVLLFIDADVPNGSRDRYRYRTAHIEKRGNGTKVFVVQGANYIPSNKLWWRDLIPPERAKHYDEGNS
jgi:hypothetical protein